jgi:hypothetical protein
MRQLKNKTQYEKVDDINGEHIAKLITIKVVKHYIKERYVNTIGKKASLLGA